MSVLDHSAQAVACLLVEISEPYREPNTGHRIEHGSLKVNGFRGQDDREFLDRFPFGWYRKTAFDVTARETETAYPSSLFAPRADPCAIEITSDPLSLSTVWTTVLPLLKGSEP